MVAGAVRTQPASAAAEDGATLVDLSAAPAEAPRAAPPARAASTRFPYEPQPEWLMLPTTNHWWGRRGGVPQAVVIRYTVITYQQTLRAFNTRASDVSAHYVVRGDGHIAYVVGEEHTAWHSGNFWYNLNSIGIELELNTRMAQGNAAGGSSRHRGKRREALVPRRRLGRARSSRGPDRGRRPPGATATFTFAVKGRLPGTYRLALRGVIDGGAWMDDLGLFTEITVR